MAREQLVTSQQTYFDCHGLDVAWSLHVTSAPDVEGVPRETAVTPTPRVAEEAWALRQEHARIDIYNIVTFVLKCAAPSRAMLGGEVSNEYKLAVSHFKWTYIPRCRDSQRLRHASAHEGRFHT